MQCGKPQTNHLPNPPYQQPPTTFFVRALSQRNNYGSGYLPEDSKDGLYWEFTYFCCSLITYPLIHLYPYGCCLWWTAYYPCWWCLVFTYTWQECNQRISISNGFDHYYLTAATFSGRSQRGRTNGNNLWILTGVSTKICWCKLPQIHGLYTPCR